MKKYLPVILIAALVLTAAIYLLSKSGNLKQVTQVIKSPKEQNVVIFSELNNPQVSDEDETELMEEPVSSKKAVVEVTFISAGKYQNQKFTLPATVNLETGNKYSFIAKSAGYTPAVLEYTPQGSQVEEKYEVKLAAVSSVEIIKSKIKEPVTFFYPLNGTTLLYVNENGELERQKLDQVQNIALLGSNARVIDVDNNHMLYKDGEKNTLKMLDFASQAATDLAVNTDLAVLKNGSYLYVLNGKLYLVDLNSKNAKELYSWSEKETVIAIRPSLSDSFVYLVTAGNDNTYTLIQLNPDTGKTVVIAQTKEKIESIRLSPDGKAIAFSTAVKLEIRDIKDNKKWSYAWKEKPQKHDFTWINNNQLFAAENNNDQNSNPDKLDVVSRIDLPTDTKIYIGSSMQMDGKLEYSGVYYASDGNYIALQDNKGLVWIVYGF